MKISLGGGIKTPDYKESDHFMKGRRARRRIDAAAQTSYASRLLAPVAQLDRVLPSEGRGRAFESRRTHHISLTPSASARCVRLIHGAQGFNPQSRGLKLVAAFILSVSVMAIPTPTDIKLHQASRKLEIAFTDGSRFEMPFEFLRVYSPSAEVRGHGPGQEVLQVGKKEVLINAAEPVGLYGINFFFSDGHDTGIYSWEYLHDIGVNQTALWDEYLRRMEAAGASRDPGIAKMFEQRPKSK